MFTVSLLGNSSLGNEASIHSCHMTKAPSSKISYHGHIFTAPKKTFWRSSNGQIYSDRHEHGRLYHGHSGEKVNNEKNASSVTQKVQKTQLPKECRHEDVQREKDKNIPKMLREKKKKKKKIKNKREKVQINFLEISFCPWVHAGWEGGQAGADAWLAGWPITAPL